MKTRYHLIIYAILVLIIFFLRECQPVPQPCPEPSTDSTTHWEHDTAFIKGDTVFYPEPYAEIDIDTFFKVVPADTAKILADYIKIRKYKLPVLNDSNGVLDVIADVQFNRITNWTYDGQFVTHIKVVEKNHVYIKEPTRKLFVGGYLSSNGIDYFGASPALMYMSKKDHAYFAGYDPLNKTGQIGMFFKIKLKK